jgi:uncharacterized HAD superfamily protein
MVVGVDIDGVLADQITGVLPRIKRRWNVDLRYEDVTHFRLPIAETDIAVEIVEAMMDTTYLLAMPVHAGAADFLTQIAQRHTVKLITARPEYALDATHEWLRRHRLRFDEIVLAKETLKSRHGADVLVDDYTGNIREFLSRSDGTAILLAQPWNQDFDGLMPWLGTPRLIVRQSLEEVGRTIGDCANCSLP